MILQAVFLFLIPVSLALDLESSYPLLTLLEKCQSKNYQLQERLSEVQSQLYEVNLKNKDLQAEIAQQAALITRFQDQTSDEATNTTQTNSTQVENLPDRCPSKQDERATFPVLKLPGLEPFKVSCYTDARNESGWMRFFYKSYESKELNQTYDQYINGFHNERGDDILGLEKLHILTTQNPHEVNAFNVFDGNFYEVKCESFVVGGRSEGYSLKRLHGCNTNTESLNLTLGTKFSTFDRDQDGNPDHNWAQELGFGFWFGSEKPILDRFKHFNFFIRRKD